MNSGDLIHPQWSGVSELQGKKLGTEAEQAGVRRDSESKL